MTYNYTVFLKNKVRDFNLNKEIRTMELYDFVANPEVKYLFAVLHQEFNRLFKFMYSKSKTNRNFNANESRELLRYIELYRDLKFKSKGTGNDFIINKQYEELIKVSESFLQQSGGSLIPNDLIKISLIDDEPIFIFENKIEIKNIKNKNNYPTKLIGEGSYAKVSKYTDEFYNKQFIIKKANNNLNEKELERFKREFSVMKLLKSPYILEVYNYDEENNQYIAEYADETIYDYIKRKNSTITIQERKALIYQIFKGFEYIHSKNYLHRDISLTNILLIHYEDTTVVKISDFGLVKEPESNLTSVHSEVKGSLNDSNLEVIGFSNYSIEYETFALTRLIMYVMTGKTNLENIKDENTKKFIIKGLDPNIENRYKSIKEMKEYFNKLF